tara:strand:- start:5305 stop:5580 length:276 start_codon:yes stop_codon:yes gene_type:complete
MKINEQTEVKLDLKGIIKIVVLTATFVGMYYTLQSDIEEAKKMPPAVIDRIEYDLKQQWQTQHIEKLEEKVDEILFWCREVDKEVYKNKKK